VLLALKIVLVPGLIATVSLAGRRWGPRVGGVLAGLPLVAGPVLLFLALEQGAAFAARAAVSTLAALTGVAAFFVAYAWASSRGSWAVGLLVGWTVFVVSAALVHAVRWRAWTALAAALLSLALARLLLPRAGGAATAPRWLPWDLWLRMAASLVLVLVTTSLAAWLGPELSGVLAPFPIASSVLFAFIHVQQGAGVVLRFLWGLVPSMWSFAVFCYVLARALEPLGVAGGFALALLVQAGLQALLLAWLRYTPSTGGSRA
jgi:hypothetical protein